MDIKQISPDQVVYLSVGPFNLNATIVYTWLVMALLVLACILITRRMTPSENMSRWQNLLEIVVGFLRGQIRDVFGESPDMYVPYIGTLFVFIAVCNLLAVVPGFEPPTASLSTTAALALTVFAAVIGFGLMRRGVKGYLLQYVQPTPMMLPFNILGEFSRTLALAVRLFGNMMSGAKIAAILLAIAPLVFPILMNALGLLTGIIQAYIFAVLAMVYIASATRVERERYEKTRKQQGDDNG
ncbi:F0F1 ATP synthase subunit A [Salidesulfovibrio onnuriiensis]|uniref:F0F1 ATP synthase subunit A n=1 Tax=Salidesulfovibrio onnuriiensis TaxID=2583823 RepID=UPI0011CC05FA|nr:F0F1 ATP synthase subunit A [Salidesulfovibrio onnuriiensis]